MPSETTVRERLLEAFPTLAADAPLIDTLAAAGELKRFSAGSALFRRGESCAGIGFFLSGEIRVFAARAGGREITLYEILPGEACVLNASCVLSRQGYPAEARALSDAEALLVPADVFRRLLAAHEALRVFVFGLFAERLAVIMELIEEVTFGSLEKRLDDYLVERAENDVVHFTHQAIASDLGTSREVVSRLLKDFERQGRVQLGRGEVILIGP